MAEGSEGSIESDKALGIGLALAFVTVIAAGVMFGAPSQLDRAGGFAAAMIASVLAVVAVQIFE